MSGPVLRLSCRDKRREDISRLADEPGGRAAHRWLCENGKAMVAAYKRMPSGVKVSGVCRPFSNASEELCVQCVHVCVPGVGVRKRAGGSANHNANVSSVGTGEIWG